MSACAHCKLAVGAVLRGFCNGAFGRDSYRDKRIEAVGADWVVARDTGSGEACFYTGVLNNLLPHLEPEEQEEAE